MSRRPAPTGGATLWLVATPIGNLSDLAPRAIEVLASCALVCCEDTRRTGLLLRHAGISAQRLAVCNEHTEAARISDVLDALAGGDDVAIVCDAGTPGLSDPGERIVRAAIDAGANVSSVPGPAAAIMALTISGLDTSRFAFEGFLPRKGRDRAARLADVAAERRTVVLYEAPHRLVRTIGELRQACGDERQVVVARELTKLYETVERGTLCEIDDLVQRDDPRGEYVIVLAGAAGSDEELSDDDIRELLRAELGAGMSRRDAVAAVAGRVGRPKRDVYDLALGLR